MSEGLKLRMWATTLKAIIREYPGKTVDNVLANIEARLELVNSK